MTSQMTTPVTPRAELTAALRWQFEAGADEAIGDVPIDRYAVAAKAAAARPAPAERPPAAPPPVASSPPVASPPPPAQRTPRPLTSADAEAESAREIAAACASLAELKAAVAAFEGCALKETATNTVFADDVHLMQIIQRVVSRVGRRIDEQSPLGHATEGYGDQASDTIPATRKQELLLQLRRQSETLTELIAELEDTV